MRLFELAWNPGSSRVPRFHPRPCSEAPFHSPSYHPRGQSVRRPGLIASGVIRLVESVPDPAPLANRDAEYLEPAPTSHIPHESQLMVNTNLAEPISRVPGG